MNVLSYNIHKGFSMGNRALVLDDIRHAIRRTGADLVCLQEVVGENRRHAHALDHWVDTQFEFLADDIWHYRVYGKNAVYDHGHHGNAILSKIPIVQHRNHDISILPASQRGVLHAITEDGVHVLCAHFGLLAMERRYQIRRLLQLLQTLPVDAPLLLAGDFNDWHEQTHRRLRAWGLREVMEECCGRVQKTFPAHWPMLRMDRIYFRHLRVRNAQRLDGADWRRLSDHCPLYAELAPC